MPNDVIRSRMITQSLLDVSTVFTSQQFVFFNFRHKVLKVEAVFAHFADTRKDAHFWAPFGIYTEYSLDIPADFIGNTKSTWDL